MKLRHFSYLSLSLAMGLTFGACSKKKVKDEGEAAADTTPMQPTDVGSQPGAPIPELNAVYFAFDSFALNGESKATLNKHVAWFRANPSRNVQIEGHTDERGTTEYNLALGERRAGAVKDYLVGHGVPAAQISTISYGEERPVDSGHTESAWAKNRRAEFVSAGK